MREHSEKKTVELTDSADQIYVVIPVAPAATGEERVSDRLLGGCLCGDPV